MYINIIKSYREVVALCDKEILGKQFEQGNMQLDVKENFYKGKEDNKPITQDKAIEILKSKKKRRRHIQYCW